MTITDNSTTAFHVPPAAVTPRIMEAAGERVAQSEHPFRHCIPLQIRFSDIDILGHVNNNAYMAMLDLGKISYYTAALGPLLDLRNIRAVVVNVNCDFLAPTYLTERLEVWTSSTRVGNRSFTIEQRLLNPDTGQQKVRAITTLCGFDPATGQGAPLDPEWVSAIEAFEGRPLRQRPTQPQHT